jgi:glycosyltransferase involved in cell wall biosynthesis
MMKVLFINKFFYLRGGSERVFFDEASLLEKHGHEVGFFAMRHFRNLSSPYTPYFMPEVEYAEKMSLTRKLRETGRILYSWEARKRLRRLLEDKKYDIAHLHNIHHQISPSILDELSRFGIPAVMTLHDYKMACSTYNLLRDGCPCEHCAQGQYYHCFLYRCTKGSFSKSLINTLEMYLHHRIMRIYGKVDRFISPSKFLQEKLQEMGFRGEIVHLPNFIVSENFEPALKWDGDSLVFFGRLSREKGIITLLDAVKDLKCTLKLIGEGPQREELEDKVSTEKISNVIFLGYKQSQELFDEIKKSMIVILPSEWYENNPISVLEAFALGKPVIGARIGGIPELIEDYKTGLTFEPGNYSDLRKKISYFLNHSDAVLKMGQQARKDIEKRFSPEIHYNKLIEIYNGVLKT